MNGAGAFANLPIATTAIAHPLAHLNAALNAAAFVLLSVGYFQIRRRREDAHRRAMLAAFGVSIVFLVSYVAHHLQVGSVNFTNTGNVRYVYWAILASHIVLAVAVAPLAIVTIVFGFRATNRSFFGRPLGRQFGIEGDERCAFWRKRHRALARWTLPIWLYVSATGIVVYIMLYQAFPPLAN